MKNFNLLVCTAVCLVSANYMVAQADSAAKAGGPTESTSASYVMTPEVKRLDAVWIFGIHGVAIDDDGAITNNLFNASKSWNYLPYPTRITAERSFPEIHSAWRLEASLAYSQYKKGTIVNDVPAFSTQPFVAFDLNAKYDLNSLFGETGIFDPYTVSGLGFTHRSGVRTDKNTPNLNLGLGFNIWIYKGLGINLQTTAKIKLNPKSSNYLMHTAGLVYRLNFLTKSKDPGTGKINQPL